MKRDETMTSPTRGVHLSEPNIESSGAETSLRSGRLKRRSDSAL